MSEEQLAAPVDVPEHAERGAHQRRRRRVQALDFRRPMKLSAGEETRLGRSHGRFCRDASVRLSAELRAAVELEVLNVAQLTWAAACDGMPASIIAIFTAEPLGTSILVALEESFALRAIDRLLGAGHEAPAVSRPLTDIDMALVRRVFDTLADGLSSTWSELFDQQLRLATIERESSVDLVSTSESTLVLTIEARDGAGSSLISILIPYASIAAVAGRLDGGPVNAADGRRADATRGVMAAAVGTVEIELRAEIAALEMRVEEILALSPGDVIDLGDGGGEGIYGGDDRRLYRVRPGRSGKHRAVQIIARADGGG